MTLLEMFRSGMDTNDIARRRGLRESEVYNLLARNREAERLRLLSSDADARPSTEAVG